MFFWQELSKRKLEIFRLSTEPVSLIGKVQIANDPRLPSTVEISSESFSKVTATKEGGGGGGGGGGEETKEEKQPTSKTAAFAYEYAIPGKLYIVNTLEDYKTKDKRQMLDDAAKNIWNKILKNQPIYRISYTTIEYKSIGTL